MGFLIRQTVNMLGDRASEKTASVSAYSGDTASHTWIVTASNSAGWLTGKYAKVAIVLPSGITVYQNGTISGDEISVTFSAATFAELGDVTAFMQVMDSQTASACTQVTTIAVIHFEVLDAVTSEVHVPEDVVLPVKDLMTKYNQLITQYSGLTNIDVAAVNRINSSLNVSNYVISPASGYVIDDGTSYSTTEVNTHKKWINGGDIYCKVFTFGASANNTVRAQVDISSLGHKMVLQIRAFIYQSGSWNTEQTVFTSTAFAWEVTGTNQGDGYTIRVQMPNPNTVNIESASRTFAGGFVVLEYIK